MKYIRSSFFGLIGTLIILQAVAVLPVAAKNPDPKSEQKRLARVMSPNADVEEFRAEMIAYLTELENALTKFGRIGVVKEQFGQNGADPIAALRHARTTMAELSADDLAAMRAVFAKVPNWREGSRAIDGIAQRVSDGRDRATKGGTNTSNVITPDACPDISGTPSFADIAITGGFEIAGDLAMELLPTDVLTILAREAVTVIRAGLKAATLAEVTLKSQYDQCHGLEASTIQDIVDGAVTTITNNDNSNHALTISAIDAAKTDIVNNNDTQTTTLTTAISNGVTTINNNSNANTLAITSAITSAQTSIINNDNANTTNIVNNDNANRVLIINNDNANAEMILRTQIEADLAEADNATFVGLYITPTANGGHADFVRFIVVDTIAKLAGSNAGRANGFLAQADALTSAGNLKAAYQYFRKAYKAAVN
ncbi:MAG: hypothetical protein DMF63_16245 [Acidobacteria bacterium]|nr:MAG: hypothetical protein DMF63_16245 [Acidobacteriota bacterium]